MSETVFTVSFTDYATIAKNTTPARPGDKVTVTFPSISPGWHDFTPKDEGGNDRLFDVVEHNGILGVMYPGRDRYGIWHDLQFTPFKNFSHSVIFTIVR